MIGWATVVVVSLHTRPAYDVAVNDPAAKAVLNGVLSLLAVPVSILVVYLLTRQAFRGELRPLRSLTKLAVFGATVVLPVIMFNLFLVGERIPYDEMNPLAILLTWVAVTLIGVWYLLYLFFAIYWAARTFCWIGEFHPLLAPSVAAILAALVTVLDLVAFDTKGLTADVWLVLTIGGLITTSALAYAEYRALRTAGVRWRTGPRPAAHSPAARA